MPIDSGKGSIIKVFQLVMKDRVLNGEFGNWSLVTDFPNYIITDQGKVYSIISNKFLKPQLHNGYERVWLCRNGYEKKSFIHRLVAMEFIKCTDDYNEVNHIDCNKRNNNASNLEWCNRSHNMKHAYKNGLVSDNWRK